MDRKERLLSLDALRGADMLFIMGFSGAVTALCALVGAKDGWLARQMTHVAWHGFHHHDTIFPLFLFLAGVSWPYSYASQRAKGRSSAAVLRKIVLRALALFALGLVSADLFAWNFGRVRYDSVLAHIGVCWAIAAVLHVFVRSWGVKLAAATALLVGHWLVLSFLRAPDATALLASADPDVAKTVASYAVFGTDGFSFSGNVAGWIDRTFMPGRLYEGVFDPDGLLAKVTGVVTALLGMAAGDLLRARTVTGNRKALLLLAAGTASLVLALVWRPWCPVNKKIWTSTFVLAAAACSFAALAAFYWIVDVRQIRGWTFFFRVIGMNSIAIYVLMRIVKFGTLSKFFFSGLSSLGNADWACFVLSLGQVLLEWLVLLFFYRKKAFFKV